MSTPSPAWREFELLIARIEQWLGPKGAIIKSPDHIIDRVTGEFREVDASIRMNVGSAPILLTVECRDRSAVQDVTWIEQVAAKRDSIGAARTIAVSSSGFSGPAIAKAADLGIELRITRDVTADIAVEWARNFRITFSLIRWNYVAMSLGLAPPDPSKIGPTALPDVFAKGFSNDSINTQFGTAYHTKQPVTVRAIVGDAIGRCPELTDNLTLGSPPVRRSLTVTVAPHTIAIETTAGIADLREIKLTVDLWREEKSPRPPKVLRYESPNGIILEVAETELEIEPGRAIGMMYSLTPPADSPNPCHDPVLIDRA